MVAADMAPASCPDDNEGIPTVDSDSRVEDARMTEHPSMDWFLVLGLTLVAVISGALFLCSVPVTVMGGLGETLTERVTFYVPDGGDWAVRIGMSVAFGIVFLACLVGVCRNARRINEPLLVTVLSIMALCSSLLWIWAASSNLNMFEDSKQLTLYAGQVASGDMSSFLPHSTDFASKLPGDLYLSNYPYQSGLFLLLVGFAKVFGPSSYVLAFEVANALATVATGILLWLVTKALGRPKGERLVAATLGITFLPPLLSVTFVYGNAIGLALFVASALAAMHAARVGRIAPKVMASVASAVLMMLSLMVKPTFTVALGGMLVIMLVHCLRRRDGILAGVTVVSLAFAYLIAGSAPIRAAEGILGYQLPQNPPKISWAIIGLSDESVLGEGLPGWWGPYEMDLQNSVDGDVAAQTIAARRALGDRVHALVSDPSYAAWFFSKKIGSIWLDPTYQSMYLSALSRNDGNGVGSRRDDGLFDPVEEGTAVGNISYAAMIAMDGTQSLMYLGIAVGCVAIMREGKGRRRALDCLMPCIFFLGFCLYVIWEAKGMYAMPFMTLMVPTAARGIAWLASHQHKRYQENEEKATERAYGVTVPSFVPAPTISSGDKHR